MTRKPLLKTMTSMAAVMALALGPVTVVGFSIAPDIAYAKNDKGNGGGNGGGNGRGGGNDRSDRGGGKDKSASNNGRSNGAKSQGGNSRSAKANGKNDLERAFKDLKRGFQKATGAKGKPAHAKGNGGSRQPKSLADAGRIFTQDVKALFGVENGDKTVKTVKTTRASAVRKSTIVSSSPRPARRDEIKAALRPEDATRPLRPARDPLARAITDPDGSDKLRNLSASGAAAAAFANASPNSNVGKIATYQEAAAEYYALREELIENGAELRALEESYEGRTSAEITEEIEGLDPNDPAYDETLGALEGELAEAEAFETERDALAADLGGIREETADALSVAEAAFFEASKGRTLTRDALEELHGNLDLPAPYAGTGEMTGEMAETDGGMTDGAMTGGESLTAEGAERPERGLRDPLARAITDPEGSDKLRNLNASNAAAAAFANASPNSNVGKIAAYQEAAAAYYGLRDELGDARSALRDYDDGYDGRSSEEIMDEIAGLDTSDPEYEARLAELEDELAEAETFEEGREALADAVDDLRRDSLLASKEAEAAFFEASRDTVLSLTALAELNANLGLPIPGN